MMTFIAMIEKVIQGSRRTVDFSLPIGMNDDTRIRKMMIRIRMSVESIWYVGNRISFKARFLRLRVVGHGSGFSGRFSSLRRERRRYANGMFAGRSHSALKFRIQLEQRSIRDLQLFSKRAKICLARN